MRETVKTINEENLRATGRLAEKQVNVALEQAELNGEIIPEEVMNFLNVFKDDATRDAIFKAPDKTGIQLIMNDNGVPMTEKDVDDLLAAFGNAGKQLAESDGKLTEEELEQISGGGIGSWFKKAWDWCTSSTVGKIITYAVVGAVAGALVIGGTVALLAAAGAVAVTAAATTAAVGVAYGGGAIIGAIGGALGGALASTK